MWLWNQEERHSEASEILSLEKRIMGSWPKDHAVGTSWCARQRASYISDAPTITMGSW